MSASSGILHTLSAPPHSEVSKRLRDQVEAGDLVLFLGGAVLATSAEHPVSDAWIESGATLHALKEDVAAYGVSNVHDGVTLIDYADWVSLTEQTRLHRHWR